MAGQIQFQQDDQNFTWIGTGWDPGAKITVKTDYTPDAGGQGTDGSAVFTASGNGTVWISVSRQNIVTTVPGKLDWVVSQNSASGSEHIG